MEALEVSMTHLKETDQIKELLKRLGFGFLSHGMKYLLYLTSQTMQNQPEPIMKTAAHFCKSQENVVEIINGEIGRAWETPKYWRILFKPDDILAKPSCSKMVSLLLNWLRENEVILYSCVERPLHSYTELRTKKGVFISQ